MHLLSIGEAIMDQTIIKEIKELGIDALAREVRAHIHQNPDLSEQEWPTRDYIISHLEQLNIPYTTGMADTGIVALIEGCSPGPVIGLRADMDALPIQEDNCDLTYRSVKSGVMHACGHDVHTAVLLGTGAYLHAIRDRLHGSVKLFFQPAEETIGGAQRMIDAGCLEDPHVDAILGLHVEPSLPTGSIGIRYGKMYACSDEIIVNVYGTASHGARPDLGKDAIFMAASIIQNVQAVFSRNLDPTDSAVCTFGTIHGGNVLNQVADHVEIQGMIRALDEDTRSFLRTRLKKVCESTASMLGGRAEVEYHPSYSPLVNTDSVVDIVKNCAQELLGQDAVIQEESAQLTVEDFAYFAMERPACFWHLGCTAPDDCSLQLLHNAGFHPDDECIPIGIALQAKAVLTLMES